MLQDAPAVQKHPEGKDIVGYCEFLSTLLEEAIRFCLRVHVLLTFACV